MAAVVLSVDGASKAYGAKVAVRDVGLEIGAGQVFGLLGPNGSGKTTTLGIILGAVLPDRGTVRWFGAGASGKERRRIGALLEQPSYYPWLSGEANLRLLAAVKGLTGETTATALKHVGLWDVRLQLVQEYSLGMKQRLAIAAALLGRPDVLVLDEPTNGVDAQGIADIRSVISAFAARGGTVLLASHMLDEVEKVCTHLAIMKDGRVLQAGPVASVLAVAGWIELAAADLDAVRRCLREIEPKARLESEPAATPTAFAVLQVYGAERTPAALNCALAERGIYLQHLIHRQPSLESQYLQLVTARGPV